MDLRTKTGQETLILNEIRENGGFFSWWLSENRVRANAEERLINTGKITKNATGYPIFKYKINGE